jgi:hypothetical protein
MRAIIAYPISEVKVEVKEILTFISAFTSLRTREVRYP